MGLYQLALKSSFDDCRGDCRRGGPLAVAALFDQRVDAWSSALAKAAVVATAISSYAWRCAGL
jgi:hypothetical protein